MRVSIHSAIVRRALGVGMAPLTAMPLATPAVAQTQALSIPAQPLATALQRIAAETGADVRYDPDAVGNVTSAPVSDARTAEAAVAQAIRGTRMSMTVTQGRIEVSPDIVVTAIRDAAETSVLVNEATTSTRTGTALRDQPRNAQVISSRLIAEQQSQTLADALRNAGGVTVNTAAVQGGITYSVRGFSTSGMVNGLPSQFGGAAYAGASQPLANIERLEVLDEATSALDADNAHRFHRLLLEELPDITLVSVVHDERLFAYHTHRMTIDDARVACAPVGKDVR